MLHFFLKKIVIRRIFKTTFLTEKLVLIFVTRHPIPSKWSCPPTNGFSQFFKNKLKNIHKVFLLESILILNKILWRINLVLIKFSPNALLFEKLQNECKNPSFLHKVTCIRSDHEGAVTKFHIHAFILYKAFTT